MYHLVWDFVVSREKTIKNSNKKLEKQPPICCSNKIFDKTTDYNNLEGKKKNVLSVPVALGWEVFEAECSEHGLAAIIWIW